jgi:hypothetical protein
MAIISFTFGVVINKESGNAAFVRGCVGSWGEIFLAAKFQALIGHP